MTEQGVRTLRAVVVRLVEGPRREPYSVRRKRELKARAQEEPFKPVHYRY